MAVMGSLLSLPTSPFIFSRDNFGTNSASLTCTPPLWPGKLSLVCVAAIGCTATPSLLTGYTSLASSAVSASTPGTRIMYRFMDGSESASVACTCTSATTMMGLGLTFDRVLVTNPPTISTLSTTSDANAVTLNSPIRPSTIAVWVAGTSLGTTNGFPEGFGSRAINSGNVNLVTRMVFHYGETMSPFDPGNWDFTGATNLASYAIAIPGP